MHTSNSSLFCGVYFVWTSATFSIFFLFIFESFIRRKPMKSKRNFKYFHFHFLQLGLIWIGWYSWNERPSTDLSMFSTSNLKEYSHKNSFKWNRMNYLFVNILLTLFSVAPANVIKYANFLNWIHWAMFAMANKEYFKLNVTERCRFRQLCIFLLFLFSSRFRLVFTVKKRKFKWEDYMFFVLHFGWTKAKHIFSTSTQIIRYKNVLSNCD